MKVFLGPIYGGLSAFARKRGFAEVFATWVLSFLQLGFLTAAVTTLLGGVLVPDAFMKVAGVNELSEALPKNAPWGDLLPVNSARCVPCLSTGFAAVRGPGARCRGTVLQSAGAS